MELGSNPSESWSREELSLNPDGAVYPCMPVLLFIINGDKADFEIISNFRR